jgi:hypothetical protein
MTNLGGCVRDVVAHFKAPILSQYLTGGSEDIYIYHDNPQSIYSACGLRTEFQNPLPNEADVTSTPPGLLKGKVVPVLNQLSTMP